MERDNATKIITIVALLVGVVGLALGFAAFSNTLTIKSSASVAPSASAFKVELTGGTGGAVAGSATSGATADTATITGTDTISGLAANFTAPGQTVTYTFSANNTGEYDAFLNEVLFSDATGHTDNKKCSVVEEDGNEVSESLLTAACNSISIQVSVGGTVFTEEELSVASHKLAKAGNEPVVVTITYAASTDNTINRPDGKMKVEFGDIKLTYGSVD